jgi:prepilin-type N-terminal cleavage/methylation domain-containing protein
MEETMEINDYQRKRRGGQQGFTLLEMLIAVVILGILAMVIIPQFTASTDDAKVSAVKADLAAMRSAIEVYYQQHNTKYPGLTQIDGSTQGTADTCGKAGEMGGFTKQLVWYSDINGKAESDASKLTAPVYGPYIKGNNLPVNPFNNKYDILCDNSETDLTKRAADGTTGWKFFMKTGILIANHGTAGHDQF